MPLMPPEEFADYQQSVNLLINTHILIGSNDPVMRLATAYQSVCRTLHEFRSKTKKYRFLPQHLKLGSLVLLELTSIFYRFS